MSYLRETRVGNVLSGWNHLSVVGPINVQNTAGARIARAVTGRRIIIKFEGHFHGLNDSLTWNVDSSPRSAEVLAGGELERLSGTVGIPGEFGKLTVVVSWNDLEALENAFEKYKGDVAGVILEPVALNIGCIKPEEGFLQSLRSLTTQHGALLIFDEVLTGFRANIGGAQKDFGVIPDIAAFGKAFGCGMPIAGIAGKAEYMDVISPRGPLQISGTNTGRYLSVSAALAAIDYLQDGRVHQHIAGLESHLKSGLRDVFDKHRIPCHIDGYGGRIGVHIGTSERPRTMKEIEGFYPIEFARKLFDLLSRTYNLYGFLMPLGYCPEPVTLSASHTPEMIANACERLDSALKRVQFHGK